PRATIATSAPEAAKRVAIASPIPFEPPVTMAERPLREMSMGVSLLRRHASSYPTASWPGLSWPSTFLPHRSKTWMPGIRPGMTGLKRLRDARVLLRFEPDQHFAAGKLEHRPLDQRRLRQHQRDGLLLGEALLVLVRQLAERGAGLVQQGLPADLFGPA